MAKPTMCPGCGEREVVPLIFGLPDPELMESGQRGEVLLGGCSIVEEVIPGFKCRRCDAEFEKRP